MRPLSLLILFMFLYLKLFFEICVAILYVFPWEIFGFVFVAFCAIMLNAILTNR